MRDGHGSETPIVGKDDMRRHPFYFHQHADGEVAGVLFHPDEHNHVVGSKRFMASTHHLVVGRQEGSGKRDWVVNETDATGPAAVEYGVRGGRGRLRPNRVVYKRQRFERSAAVPHMGLRTRSIRRQLWVAQECLH